MYCIKFCIFFLPRRQIKIYLSIYLSISKIAFLFSSWRLFSRALSLSLYSSNFLQLDGPLLLLPHLSRLCFWREGWIRFIRGCSPVSAEVYVLTPGRRQRASRLVDLSGSKILHFPLRQHPSSVGGRSEFLIRGMSAPTDAAWSASRCTHSLYNDYSARKKRKQ